MTALFAGCLLFTLAGCRGDISERPPIHPNLNMDNQEKFDPQEENAFFLEHGTRDGRAARMPVPGTVARGAIHADLVYYTGMEDGRSTSTFVMHSPVPVTMQLLKRGQERYNIYCGVCHDRAGTGKGLIVANFSPTFAPPPSFVGEERIRVMPDGEVFNSITHGIRTMPSYGAQISEADRWAIIAYLRALQRSQHAALADIPEQYLSTLGNK